MFAESTRVCTSFLYIYIYNEHTFAPPFLFLSLLYYIYIRETLFPTPYPFPPLSYLPFVYSFIIYSIYREEYTFPQLFTLFPLIPILLLYSLYIQNDTHFARPFLPLYKVNTFTPPFSLLLLQFGKSLRGKVFENFISIVL